MGTTSARAGIFKKGEDGGKLINKHSEEIKIFKPQDEFFEQSSENIWEKICECVKKVSADLPKNEIVGIGFDATCSLVLLDKNYAPLTASPSGQSSQNVIMWLDHRAKLEADEINASNHEILKFVGGNVSLEMEVPKLLWLKRNINETYKNIHLAFDLPDFLTWRATGQETRSVCSLTCKWNYDAINGMWCDDFFKTIGLDELTTNNYSKIGQTAKLPGEKVGGLSKAAAKEMGLLEGTAVACSMIDAHAGALGLIASQSSTMTTQMELKLILIAGTSTCHMSITEECLFSKGIWGPYKHALLPNNYLIEAGQSASGILIQHIVENHPGYSKILADLKEGENIYDILFDGILKLAAAQNLESFHELTKDFHIYPDFHGNRSPIGDSNLKGVISGCTMHDSIYVSYLAVVQSLAYQTRHIIDSLYSSGRKHFKTILICGGLSKNQLFIQAHADICGVPISISNETESVLMGAAMLGATASGVYGRLEDAAKDLSNSCYQISPDVKALDFHLRKYRVFLKMLEDQRSYSNIMNSA